MNFTICASGNLGFVVLHYLINKSVDVALVLTDSHSESIISFCKENNIRCFKGNPRNGRFVEWKSKEKIQICHLLSINYLFILDKEIMDLISGYAINFHGSLLPKYRGRTPHVWAIINGEDRCGITAHQMNDKCDDGDIVRQVVVDIEDTDTGASVLEKYNRIYPTLVLDVVNDINLNRLVFKPQDSSKATYFSKRTPEDGEINWNWQKERIRNWVRAQAKPYPGAFTYYNGVKVVINKVEYVDDGFLDTMPNGLIISFKSGKPIVKTPNGAVLLLDIFGDVNFELNEMFGHQHIDNETNTLCGGVKFVDYTNCNIRQLYEILKLRNLPEIRQFMVNRDEILFSQHLLFVQSLACKRTTKYYAVYKDGELYASVNIRELEDSVCERGIYSAPSIQGKGITSMLENYLNQILKEKGYKTIDAKVRIENNRSIRYHHKIGYVETDRDSEYIYFKLDL